MDIQKYISYRLFTMKFKFMDVLYKITKNDRFYYEDSEPTYSGEYFAIGTPLIDTLNFFIYIPCEQIVGKEYFLVANHYSRFLCIKIAKISFYSPKYVKNNLYIGKKEWIFSLVEKIHFMSFINSKTYGFTCGLSVFQYCIDQYNHNVNPPWENSPQLEISENIPIPDYMKLPDQG